MNQWSHSHGRGHPRCYDSLCGLSPEDRADAQGLMAMIFYSLFLCFLFLLALSVKEFYVWIFWGANLALVIYSTRKLYTESKIIVAFIQVPVLLVHMGLLIIFT